MKFPLARSKSARVVIALVCAYALAGSYAFHTLPLSSPAPPSWYHHPSIVITGMILTLPASLFMILLSNLYVRDGGQTDQLLSTLLASINPIVVVIWCIIMFFLLNRVVRWFGQHHADRSTPQSDAK